MRSFAGNVVLIQESHLLRMKHERQSDYPVAINSPASHSRLVGFCRVAQFRNSCASDKFDQERQQERKTQHPWQVWREVWAAGRDDADAQEARKKLMWQLEFWFCFFEVKAVTRGSRWMRGVDVQDEGRGSQLKKKMSFSPCVIVFVFDVVSFPIKHIVAQLTHLLSSVECWTVSVWLPPVTRQEECADKETGWKGGTGAERRGGNQEMLHWRTRRTAASDRRCSPWPLKIGTPFAKASGTWRVLSVSPVNRLNYLHSASAASQVSILWPLSFVESQLVLTRWELHKKKSSDKVNVKRHLDCVKVSPMLFLIWRAAMMTTAPTYCHKCWLPLWRQPALKSFHVIIRDTLEHNYVGKMCFRRVGNKNLFNNDISATSNKPWGTFKTITQVSPDVQTLKATQNWPASFNKCRENLWGRVVFKVSDAAIKCLRTNKTDLTRLHYDVIQCVCVWCDCNI